MGRKGGGDSAFQFRLRLQRSRRRFSARARLCPTLLHKSAPSILRCTPVPAPSLGKCLNFFVGMRSLHVSGSGRRYGRPRLSCFRESFFVYIFLVFRFFFMKGESTAPPRACLQTRRSAGA